MSTLKAIVFTSIVFFSTHSLACRFTETQIDFLYFNAGIKLSKIYIEDAKHTSLFLDIINQVPPITYAKGSYLIIYGAREGGIVQIVLGEGPNCLNFSIKLAPSTFIEVMEIFIDQLRSKELKREPSQWSPPRR